MVALYYMEYFSFFGILETIVKAKCESTTKKGVNMGLPIIAKERKG